MSEKKQRFLKSPVVLSHLLTYALLIGYIVYWAELYWIQKGQGTTSLLAPILFAVFFILAIVIQRNRIHQLLKQCIGKYKQQARFVWWIIFIGSGLGVLIGLVTLLALFLPPHLPQEFDALNYHLTIPRQHLINGTFEHIRWSAADLFPLPIQFALAPYWLAREVPSKFIHIFFIYGLLTVSLNFVRRFSKNKFLSLFIVLFAILGSHNVGIQMPVLMLDLAMCYLLIASIDSFLERRFFLSAIEFSFFIWSKSFYAPQIIVILTIMVFTKYFLNKFWIRDTFWCFEKSAYGGLISKKAFKKLVLYIFFVSVVIGGPFVVKSLYYAGTPLFPFFPGLIELPHIDQSSAHWQSIMSSSQIHVSTKDAYGSGRSLLDFLKHLWFVAIPEKQTMNRYDYPLGLPYLLFLAPFLYFVFISFKKKIFPILPFFAIIYWITWWFGSQQARFLYIPLILIFITVAAKMKKPTRLFMFSLVLALSFNFISIFRAHFKDIGRSSAEVLRERDKSLLEINRKYLSGIGKYPITLDYYDLAYAIFPVKIVCENDYWVLEE